VNERLQNEEDLAGPWSELAFWKMRVVWNLSSLWRGALGLFEFEKIIVFRKLGICI
jgi:hypothetical protein